jgi:hypothetical protein
MARTLRAMVRRLSTRVPRRTPAAAEDSDRPVENGSGRHDERVGVVNVTGARQRATCLDCGDRSHRFDSHGRRCRCAERKRRLRSPQSKPAARVPHNGLRLLPMTFRAPTTLMTARSPSSVATNPTEACLRVYATASHAAFWSVDWTKRRAGHDDPIEGC